MTFGCLAGAAAAIVFIIVLFAVGYIIARIISNSLRRAADRAVGTVVSTAAGIAGQAMNRAVDIGAQELVKGAHDLGRTISDDIKRKDPKWVTVQINSIAHRNRGEVTMDRVISELAVTEEMAASVLEELVGKNVCFVRDDNKDPVKTYIFPGFKEKREIKICEHCNSVFTPDDAEDRCLNCGAPLKLTTTIV